jgi:hemerythrin-like domain-containing protein
MSKNIDILPLMVKDHCKIEKLLDEFEENADKDHTTALNSFNKLEWELEKHIFIEEKAIFTSYNPKDVVEGYVMLPELTKQHNVLLNKLNNMKKDVRRRTKPTDLYGFKEFLIKHRTFEEQEVYPKLDENLDTENKKIIFDKINEII